MAKKEEIKPIGKGEHGNIWASWSFLEVPKYERSKSWWIFMSLLALILLIWAFKTRNFLFAFIIFLVAFIVIRWSKEEPLTVEFKITDLGLEVGSSFYEWSKIENFWIVYKPNETKRVYFKLKGILPPYLSIPLENQNPVLIRRILLKFALEDLSKEDETFSDFLSRTLKI
jgi:hypothetical protein